MKSHNEVLPFSFPGEITLTIKREDQIHPFLSGNKFRKMYYNLEQARNEGYNKLLTFGGAFSNHIAAVAAAGAHFGLETIGVIRGEELEDQIRDNATLRLAQQQGMKFDFVSREAYRDKEEVYFLESLKVKHGAFYLLPEGGTNALAVKGCEEILDDTDRTVFTHICCAVGTGGTISGLINSCGEKQRVIGFPALKGSFLSEEICKFVNNDRWNLINDYHFGGYAKINAELVRFINTFYAETNIMLDPVYTAKMAFGILDLIKKGYFPEKSAILMIHTGGLQGVEGMNKVLTRKKLPLIIEMK
ncbi:1-aminocyclopropane-1-carboxylate deaminase/D-cysteine desulfhydrase [Flavobacterium cerinum]|uniref:Pyridoxal-phosphate dependent enzyme n=1 Tax=Flavobacterium cerinum TaxID=2502784 RepID=A0ABY5ISP7_9FLAO|nr:pyridoxal-phosphate dependent enzyme [Flavobacterium cerinum]UUC45674.1 pyridoxal-phosphate dependent enzyme [Flavobacterium cerinum]